MASRRRSITNRAAFLSRALTNGIAHVGEISQRNLNVGVLLLLTLGGVTVVPALTGLGVGPTIVIYVAIAVGVLLDGAYIEWSRERAGRVEAEARIPSEGRDHAIIASLSEQAKQRFSGWARQLAQGDLSTRMFEDFVVAELVEHKLVTIAYVQPGPRAISHYAVPHLNLTEDGARILRKIRSAKGEEG